jgi:Beta-propeller repeat
LPLSFEINRGQTDGRVKFLSRGKGYSLFLTGNEAVFRLNDPVASRQGLARNHVIADKERKQRLDIQPGVTSPKLFEGLNSLIRLPEVPTASPDAQATSVLRMQLMGANPAAQVSGLEELPGKSNYFIGNDPKKWRTNVLSYAKVKYQDIYPGIDLVYYGNQRQLEYDFVVQPRSNPSQIALNIESEGASSKTSVPRVNAQGDLVVTTGTGEVIFQKPVVYQPAGDETPKRPKTLDGHYLIRNDGVVTFEVAFYDRRKPLVIDPVLGYSTYLGGTLGDFATSIAVDSSGNAFVTGFTDSGDFPSVDALPAPNNALQGIENAFVNKLGFSGSNLSLVYSTYLGGSGCMFFGDQGTSIAVDSSGNAYVTGRTCSPDFPTVNPLPAPNNTLRGSGDAFVSKLNATGTALIYSTYLGGSDSNLPENYGEIGQGIALDASGDAYITGITVSSDFPTVNALPAPNNALQGSQDAFVSKLFRHRSQRPRPGIAARCSPRTRFAPP